MFTNAQVQTLIFGLLLVAGILGLSPKLALATDSSGSEYVLSSQEQPCWLKVAIRKEAREHEQNRVPDAKGVDFEILGAIRHRDQGQRRLRAGIGLVSSGVLIVIPASVLLANTKYRPCGRYDLGCLMGNFGVPAGRVISGTGIALGGVGLITGTLLILNGIKQRKRAQNHLRKMGLDPKLKRSQLTISVRPEIGLKKQGVALAMTF